MYIQSSPRLFCWSPVIDKLSSRTIYLSTTQYWHEQVAQSVTPVIDINIKRLFMMMIFYDSSFCVTCSLRVRCGWVGRSRKIAMQSCDIFAVVAVRWSNQLAIHYIWNTGPEPIKRCNPIVETRRCLIVYLNYGIWLPMLGRWFPTLRGLVICHPSGIFKSICKLAVAKSFCRIWFKIVALGYVPIPVQHIKYAKWINYKTLTHFVSCHQPQNSQTKIHMPSHQIPTRMANLDHAIYIYIKFNY